SGARESGVPASANSASGGGELQLVTTSSGSSAETTIQGAWVHMVTSQEYPLARAIRHARLRSILRYWHPSCRASPRYPSERRCANERASARRRSERTCSRRCTALARGPEGIAHAHAHVDDNDSRGRERFTSTSTRVIQRARWS